MKARATIALAALALVLGACEVENDLRVVFRSDRVRGFACVDSSTTPPRALLQRAAGHDRVSLVTDLLDFGGFSGNCRAVDFLEHCAAPRSCTPIAERRVCSELPGDAFMGLAPTVPIGDVISPVLGDALISADAPEGTVVIRTVLARGGCDAYLDPAVPFDRAALIGCVSSCPVELDRERGDIELELDFGLARCTELDVYLCAEFRLPE